MRMSANTQNGDALTETFSNPEKNVRIFAPKDGAKVADFGAGSGAYTMALAEAVGSRGEVYAVDIQQNLLSRIAHTAEAHGYENVKIVWGDIEEVHGVHIRDEAMDMVVIANTLFQVDDKHRVLQEAWRVLKPNGTLVIIDWDDSFRGLGPRQEDVVTRHAASMLAVDNGFVVQKHFDAGAHHYGLICKKVSKSIDE